MKMCAVVVFGCVWLIHPFCAFARACGLGWVGLDWIGLDWLVVCRNCPLFVQARSLAASLFDCFLLFVCRGAGNKAPAKTPSYPRGVPAASRELEPPIM